MGHRPFEVSANVDAGDCRVNVPRWHLGSSGRGPRTTKKRAKDDARKETTPYKFAALGFDPRAHVDASRADRS